MSTSPPATSDVNPSRAQACARDLSIVFMRLTPLMKHAMSGDGAMDTFTFQRMAVLKLVEHGLRSPSELAERLGLTRSGITALTDGLVEQGYLTRATDQADRRQLILSITPAGGEAVATAYERAVERVARFLEALSPTELDDLSAGMTLIEPVLQRLADLGWSNCKQPRLV